MSKLLLVPTPIGNLGDITLRALEVLRNAAAVLAEDTRNSGKLLKHYQIKAEFIAFHAHNEHRLTPKLVERLQSGDSLALVTDAGTPGISDPGFLLVRACIAAGIEVETLPGATAFVPALVNSGFPTDRFCFEGFLPIKKGRKKRIDALSDERRTTVLYESPHRLIRTLTEMADALGEGREASISREITKLHEETIRGTLGSLKEHFTRHSPKGEFVIVLKGNPDI